MISCESDDTLVLLEQTSAGVFNSRLHEFRPIPGRMTSGDFNGDGDQDIAVVTVDQTGSPLSRYSTILVHSSSQQARSP